MTFGLQEGFFKTQFNKITFKIFFGEAPTGAYY